MNFILLSFIIVFLCLFFVLFLVHKISRLESGSQPVKEIGQAIKVGARTFLTREFKTMSLIFALVALGLFFLNQSLLTGLVFLIGAITSSFAGYVGMMVSTMTNYRTAVSAQKSFSLAFKTAIWGGQVMGFLVVGLGLLGILIFWVLFEDTEILLSFALGASLVALFMRVGGGIFTKSADIGADLVGKVEQGIPEDDPRNPAVIADQVGDNVGDIAGMGSDLFESYVSAIIAAMIIGGLSLGREGVIFPLALAALGIVCSMIGTFFVSLIKDKGQSFLEQTESVRKAMERGVYIANALMLISAYFLCRYFFGEISYFWAVVLGLLTGLLIGKTTEYYTSEKNEPTLSIAQSASSGASSVIIQGLIVGLKSTLLPVLAVAATIVLSFYFGGLYGIALASLGILAVLGINLSTDCYGPIADNAAGIAEMAEMGQETRQKVEALDAVGNSTAAVGKGFAIGAAALAALAWLVTYSQRIDLEIINLLDARLLAALFIGAMLPFFFSALTMKGVGKGALEVVEEVRRQFRKKAGLMAGKEKADEAYGFFLHYYCKSFDGCFKGVFPGIITMLNKLRLAGYNIGLVTGKSRPAWDFTAEKIQLGDFDVVVTDNDVQNPKPDPEGLIIAAELLKISSEDRKNIIYVGDSINDLKAAENAGMIFGAALWAGWGNTVIFEERVLKKGGSNFILNTPLEIFDYLK